MPPLSPLGYRAAASTGGEDEFWFDEYRAEHDARGNVNRLFDALGNATTLHYDPARGLDPVRSENAEGHVHTAAYHPRLRTITTLTDPAGNATHYDYTPLGRVAREIRPGDSAAFPTVEFTYDTASLAIATTMVRRRVAGTTATRTSVSYYDGRGNTLQTRGQLDDGSHQASGLEIRDLRDLVIESRAPFRSPSSAFDLSEGAPATSPSFRYDVLKRTTEVVNAGGERSHAVFTPQGIEFHDTQDNDIPGDGPRLRRLH